MATPGNVPPSLKADVWQHFGFKNCEDSEEPDKSKAVCKMCKMEVKHCGNTTNLRNHLTRHHPDIPLAKTADTKQRSLEKAFAMKLASTSPRAQKITQSVATFICKDIRPYSVVENDGFQNLINTLEPRYVLPSRKHLSEVVIPNMYEKVKHDVTASLKSAERVAITCDSWTSRATDNYLTITSHHIDQEWRLVSHVLQTRTTEASHTAANLSEIMFKAIEEWELTNKNPVIVTDNAANMVRAVEITGWLHIGCFAHTLNLASQAGLKVPAVAQLLGRVRRIASFFHRSTVASRKLKEKQKILNLPAHKLVTDGVTRWNSTLEMLERFLEQQPAISAALLSPEVRRSDSNLCSLTEADITDGEDIVKALKPLKAATLVMSEEKSPTLSIIAPLHAQLLEKMISVSHDSSLIKDLKTAVYDNLKSRYVALKDKLYIASALDPRFKALPFLSKETCNNTFSQLVLEAAGLENVDTAIRQSDGDTSEETVPDISLGGVDEVDYAPPIKRSKDSALIFLLGPAYSTKTTAPQKTPTQKTKEEVNRYRDVEPVALSEDPLIWWRDHEREYPLLALQAKQYLSIPGTSVPSERVFSTAGDIVTAQRSCLTPQHVDQLLFLQKNLTVSKK
ncbi:E3 SUMO-protein ligase ZBED1-like [Maylandia zebra]|uniref:E3 SUMO-protein ligase ZBED1-like n=1 Tax=Maylandia zebra TaxID=106582 RepID=UPI00403D3FCD